MITADLTKKIDLLPQESYKKVESLVEHLSQLNTQVKRENAFRIFMDKMNVAEESVRTDGWYSEEEAEEELSQI